MRHACVTLHCTIVASADVLLRKNLHMCRSLGGDGRSACSAESGRQFLFERWQNRYIRSHSSAGASVTNCYDLAPKRLPCYKLRQGFAIHNFGFGGHPWAGQPPIDHVRTRNAPCLARATPSSTVSSGSSAASCHPSWRRATLPRAGLLERAAGHDATAPTRSAWAGGGRSLRSTDTLSSTHPPPALAPCGGVVRLRPALLERAAGWWPPT